MRLAGRVACIGDRSGAYIVLLARPEGKRPLGRPRCRWKDNIKVDLREVGWRSLDWIDRARDRWWAVVNLWGP
jgi:hypothetical protein